MSLRVVFMGTPDFAVPTLSEVVGQGHEVAAVYTRPPAAAGRGMELKPSPVHRMAERFGLPVLTPRTLRGEEAAETFRGHGADVRSEEHTSELQSRQYLVCRLLLEKK